VKNLSVEISDNQSSEFEEILEKNFWSKAVVVRALVKYFLSLSSVEQDKLVKAHGVKKKVKKRKEEVES
jgi:hypothetical protein